MNSLIIIFSVVAVGLAQEKCPLGGEIYARGLNQNDINTVLAAHNNYRLDIANGRVAGQPRGNNLKRMVFDTVLAQKAQVVSNSCQIKHIVASDNRWSAVGQNLYISWSSVKATTPDWKAAVKSWFNENKYFTYPSTSSGVTGHYTQVIWADSNNLGCDFIAFYDVKQPKYPYARLYTCNYGPAGNYVGVAPYKTGGTGCENLC